MSSEENLFESSELASIIFHGERIARAIAQSVMSEGMPTEWTGLDPQDVDAIPDGLDRDLVEQAAEFAYREIMDGRGL